MQGVYRAYAHIKIGLKGESMTANDDFFQEQKPAAVLKHSILSEYCNVFTSMLGSHHEGPIWIIDGYAGPGSYDPSGDESEPTYGSPLIAANLAREWGARSTRDLRCVFIEADRHKATALRRNLEPFLRDGVDAVVLDGAVEEQLHPAWELVSDAPVITFLDPFGVAMPRYLMTNLLLAPGRSRPSEVLLNINVEAVSRLGGCLERREGEIVPKRGQERSVEHVDEFLGDTWWRSQFYNARNGDAGTAAVAAASVAKAFRRRIEEATGCLSISIPIRRAPHHPDLFHLTLFFRHPYAGYKFADAASRATYRWRTAYRARAWDAHENDTLSLFDEAEVAGLAAAEAARRERELSAQSIATISKNIRTLITERRQISLSNDIVDLLGTSLSFAGEKHIRRAWDILSDERVVQPRNKAAKMYKATMVAMR